MLSSNNILSPASGRVLATPTQDMVLGIYYLTYCETDLPNSKAEDLDPRPKRFQNEEEVEFAIDSKQVTLQQPIEYRWKENVILTTAGRVIFNAEIDRALEYAVHVEVEGPLHEFLNLTLSKKELGDFIGGMVDRYGAHAVAATLDKIKQLGFHYATLAGITISKNDIVIPTSKEQILAGYEERVAQVAAQYERGLITEEERHESIVNIWTEATDAVADAMEDTLWELNPVFMMANSGARGSFKQIRQLAGMRGLMANPKGEIIERPIKANFMEGLSVLEYFISTHGARKGLADTALRTADSGYLTRRLVDVSQDVIVRDDDCGTTDFVELPIYLPEGQNKNLGGRVLAANVCRPVKDGKPGKTVIAEKGTVLSNPVLRMIIEEFGEYAATASLPVRSVLKCRSEVGVCQACYGIFLATGTMCEIGDSVGIIAAQSIGEPGTQLTMRTFHTGGVAGADITHGLPRVVEIFEARNPKGAARLAEVPGRVEIESTDRGYHVLIHQDGVDDKGEQLQPKEYTFARRSRLLVTDGQMVEPGDALNEGSLSPSELLELKGPTATELYLVGEVQKVYKSQGVDIHDKHVELIVRQMLKKVRVDNSGETELLPGQLADRSFVKRENAKARAESKEEATYEPLILGITKASLATESWLSAASFQETTKVLTDAAIEGKTDRLVGLKENVIIGKLIPAATGLKRYRTIEIKPADKVPVAAFVRPETGEQLLAELEEIGSDAGGGLATLLEEEPGGSVELETEAAGESDHDADNPSEKK
jgi:DNA-directed RNA polymerase subunit beta'